MAEMLDIYDTGMNHIGVKERGAVHRDGDWHKVFQCWVIYRDENGADWMVMQKRASTKAIFPDVLDVSAAGHYGAGESVEDGVRELEEELGLFPKFEELISVGHRVQIQVYEENVDHEVADVFFYICDQPLGEYVYQQDELAGLIALNVADGLRLFSGEVDFIEVPSVGLESDVIQVRREDFVPVLDHYWEKVFVLVQRCLNGENHLFI